MVDKAKDDDKPKQAACLYCGHKNDVDAAACAGCGIQLRVPS